MQEKELEAFTVLNYMTPPALYSFSLSSAFRHIFWKKPYEAESIDNSILNLGK